MRLLSLFSGIGAFEKALERLGFKYELVGFSEIDKYAIQSYCAIHGVTPDKNLGDVRHIKGTYKNIDILTYGFPCQDISISGKQKGLEKGTRSSLYTEALRIIKENKPKVAIMENVKNLVGKRFKPYFDDMLLELESYGYNNYWKILNAKDYGVPQNRERVFVISIRKDIDKGFNFPEPFDNGIRLKDLLEDEVDEKYYLSDKILEGYKKANKIKGNSFPDNYLKKVGIINTDSQGNRVYDPNNIACAQVTQAGGLGAKTGLYLIQDGEISKEALNDNERQRRVYNPEGICPSLLARSNSVKIIQSDKLPVSAKEEKEFHCVAMRGRYEDGNIIQKLEERKDGNANTITTVTKDNLILKKTTIRKLTPKECWRLMGFDDTDFEKASAVCSNTQLYKQAGNSIVVNVIEKIFEKKIKELFFP